VSLTTEQQYFSDKAALLDPRAYVMVFTDNFGTGGLVVPPGETWFLVNGWYLASGLSSPDMPWFHRPAHVDKATTLPAGTVLQAWEGAGDQKGIAYYCRPALVTSQDSRYTTDPISLYYSRLATLKTLGLNVTGLKVPKGTPLSTEFFVTFNAPGGAPCMVRHVSLFEVPWAVPFDTSSVTNAAMNVLNEISDTHSLRSAEEVLFPFTAYDQKLAPTGLGGFNTRCANPAGDQTSPQPQDGFAVVHWSQLPTGW
jgi:hypothetical protein